MQRHWTFKAVCLLALLAVLALPVPALSQEAASVTTWNCAAGQGDLPYPVMRPDPETLARWHLDYASAPQFSLEAYPMAAPASGSKSLLNHLTYTPVQRNQGQCGNCWVWAGIGVMEIDRSVQRGVRQRLSVQHLNSCKAGSYACCGGWLRDVTNFYNRTNRALPWVNVGGNFVDGTRRCNDGSSTRPCNDIRQTPNVPITRMSTVSINTTGLRVSQANAIANIKAVLDSDRAVWFGYFLPNTAAWTAHQTNFWNNQGENALWDPDPYCGQRYNRTEGGGHAVVLVGYNDEDPNPNNHYWEFVNSWGTAGGTRPNGLFRMKMRINYKCSFTRFPLPRQQALFWQTLNIGWPTTLTVRSSGVPSAAITSIPAAYGGTAPYSRTNIPHNANIILTAPANSGNAPFSSWTGCDTANNTLRRCWVRMSSNKTVTANYTATGRLLNVRSIGAAGVPITAVPASYAGTTNYQRANVPNNALITLTAPLTHGGAHFQQWRGCTSSTGRICTLRVTANSNVAAVYGPSSLRTLTVRSVGASGVPVTAFPPAYGGTTAYTRANITNNATIRLTAPRTRGAAQFRSWAGCTNTVGTTCVVRMTENKSVTVHYMTPQHRTLAVRAAGATGVRIEAVPAAYQGVAPYNRADIRNNASIVLTAPATSGNTRFRAWTGCDVANTALRRCMVRMNANKVVTAYYTAEQRDPSVGGKYFNLLQTVPCPSDIARYGAFRDWGRWSGSTYCGQQVRSGYWVWVQPNWYIWGNRR